MLDFSFGALGVESPAVGPWCCNWLRRCASGIDPAKVETKAKDSVGSVELFQSIVKFEEVADASPGYVTEKMKAEVPMPEWVVLFRDSGFTDEMVMGYFWPQDVYHREEGHALPTDRCVEKEFKGRTLIGIWRGEDKGAPPGVIRRTAFDKDYASHGKEVANNKHQNVDTSFGDVMNTTVRAVADFSVTSNTETGDLAMALSKESDKDRRIVLDSDDEWMPTKKAKTTNEEFENTTGAAPATKRRGKKDTTSAGKEATTAKTIKHTLKPKVGAPQGKGNGGSPLLQRVSGVSSKVIKIPPSHQLRSITASMRVESSAAATLATLRTQIGLQTTQPDELRVILGQIDSKITDENVQKLTHIAPVSVLYSDTGGVDGGPTTLSEKGLGVATSLRALHPKVEAGIELLDSYQGVFGGSTEAFGSASFLDFAIQQAEAVGLPVHQHARVLLCSSQVMDLLKQNLHSVVPALFGDSNDKGFVSLGALDLPGEEYKQYALEIKIDAIADSLHNPDCSENAEEFDFRGCIGTLETLASITTPADEDLQRYIADFLQCAKCSPTDTGLESTLTRLLSQTEVIGVALQNVKGFRRLVSQVRTTIHEQRQSIAMGVTMGRLLRETDAHKAANTSEPPVVHMHAHHQFQGKAPLDNKRQ